MAAIKTVPVKVRVTPSAIWAPRGRLTARQAIAATALRLGGVDGLVEWVRKDPKNEYMFWTRIYPRLIPVEVTVEAGKRLARALKWRPPT